ncbi:hydrogenase nickel incorporation protein HypB [Amycolatopsis sp. OK19-0408]|uniref:Hydrogenase nickel incorporation protein HypB n=1 Tax=Amycolatopsis iheyensis TaxID=2945988 RepID=A0A9X2NLN7_9PSEU|nr:hydrogenase nickel incorporation protein HypB [Amycolatopsis iheyensis]MCR6489708.1 hydrogenase nickel incorporation protein HypB [Amycolatopsis iheyensis]
MCDTCGCSDSAVRITDRTHTVVLEQDILAKNDELASHNRTHLSSSGVFAINLMSSPGAGKTTLLERTIGFSDTPCAVIEGDQETLLDAERIKATGAPVVQINTGAGCHLDASMVHRALHSLSLTQGSTLFIENVGNLVCPALFDLGEAARVVILSVTEGPGKPVKYPHMFAATDLVLLNKIDLLPYVDFDVAEFERDVRRVNRSAAVLRISATRGDGMAEWRDWLRRPDRS